jgi:hypothetical protein
VTGPFFIVVEIETLLTDVERPSVKVIVPLLKERGVLVEIDVVDSVDPSSDG